MAVTRPRLIGTRLVDPKTGVMTLDGAQIFEAIFQSSADALAIDIDGGGAAVTTGFKGYRYAPVAGTITAAVALADQVGSITVDVWKAPFTSFPPTDANSITASAPVTLSSAQSSRDQTLTGWTVDVAAGDVLGFNVDSAATVTRVTISLAVQKI